MSILLFRKTLAQRIAALFSGGKQGAWYEPSFATGYQDSAGTTAQTAVEQPTGKRLDKSGNSNHASQATAGSRPTLSARVNLLTKSDDLSNAAIWPRYGGATVTGTNTINLPTAGTDGVSQSTGAIVGVAYTASVVLSGSGTTTLVPANYGADQTITLTATPTRYYFSGVATNVIIGTYIFRRPGNTATVVEATDFQVESGSTSTRYQRVNTATDYDTAGFPLYDKFDGTDDSLTSATGGGASAGFFLCQAIKPTGGAGAVRTIWSDVGTNTGYKVQLDAANKLSFSAGNATAYTTKASTATVDVGTTSLITVWDDGTNLNVQIGSAAAETVARPVVSAGTAGFTVGKDNGAATSFFTGNLYPEVYRQTSLSAGERATVQAYCRSKAGL